jgi:hypothetical protein
MVSVFTRKGHIMETEYKLVVLESLWAPDCCRWSACWDSYDIDVPTGTGPTKEDAVFELVALWGFPK